MHASCNTEDAIEEILYYKIISMILSVFESDCCYRQYHN